MRIASSLLKLTLTKTLALLIVLSLLIAPATTALAQTDGATANAPVGVTMPGGADLFDAPGGEELGHLRSGIIVTLDGRTADAAWLLVTAGTLQGWMESTDLLIASLAETPVVESAAVTLSAPAAELAPVSPTVDVAAAPLSESLTASTPVTVATTAAISSTTPITASPANQTILEPAGQLAAQSPSILLATVTTGGPRLNVRATPASAGALVTKVEAGSGLVATGRTIDGSWIAVTLSDGTQGWVSSTYLTLAGDASALPATTEDLALYTVTPAADGDTATGSTAPESVSTTVDSGPTPTQATGGGLAGTLVFQDGMGTIYTYDLDTAALAPLATGYDPAISPDGSRVAFLRSGSEGGVFTVNIDGSNETRIAGYRTGLSSPKWSPDGASILFARGDDYIECYPVGNECLTELPEMGGGPGMGAAINADNIEQTRETTWHVTAIDADGANLRDLPTTYSVATPDWGAEGVVYLSKEGIQITGDGDGATNRRVYKEMTGPATADADIQPDGSLIVFQMNRGGHWELYTVSTDGSGATALTRPSTTLVDALPSNVSPAWSPDGGRIVFLSNRTSSGDSGPWHLWVMNADGSDQQMIPVDLLIEYSYGNEQMVDWGV